MLKSYLNANKGNIASITALTFLPPMWMIYLIAGGIGAVITSIVFEAAIALFNIAVVWPEITLVHLLNSVFHCELGQWGYANFIPFFSDSTFVIQKHFIFKPLLLAFGSLTWLSFVAKPALALFAKADAEPKQPKLQ